MNLEAITPPGALQWRTDVYHLTCPSCHDVTDSPFIRSGAVVRCASCEHKYRIKSSHFDREVLTGPRTLDETDSVLRSDSVDIDPDEIAPVSIDDEGNVVGLSGLSELMRWSDTHGKGQSPHSNRVPSVGEPDSSAVKPLEAAKPADDEPAAANGLSARARAQAINRKKRTRTLVLVGYSCAVVVVFAVVVSLMLPRDSASPHGTAEDSPMAGNADPDPGTTVIRSPITGPLDQPPDQPPDQTADQTPDQPRDQATLFPLPDRPSPNPDPKFVSPWAGQSGSDAPPPDVPTVLTPGRPLSYEGWYVMNPARGFADAVGVSDVELGELTPTSMGQGMTLLRGAVTNGTPRTVLNGELHVMLLDSTGKVFAETYTPLVMIEPGGEQAISLPIASRYWDRSRGVRAGVQVMDWADADASLQGVYLDPVGQGAATALRVSVKHSGERPLRNVTILIQAADAEGQALGRFYVTEENLYITQDQWLDLVIATPLPQGRDAADWSVRVQSK